VLVLGVDACRTGWIAVALGGHQGPEAHYLPTIDEVQPLCALAGAVAIDIPIGLPANGPREADVLARAFLHRRRSSVFLTPVRQALEAETYALATHAATALTGRGISQQAYALKAKILEVERWLHSAPAPVYEVHPEVSFAVLLGAPARASKKTWAGMVERRKALEAAGISLDEIVGSATVHAAVDDMLDAAVAAWTAGRIAAGTARSFPDPPHVDSSGNSIAILA